MNRWSERSRTNLNTTHFDLQQVFNKVLVISDCSIICGHRGKEVQNAAFADGKSLVQFPDSKHNSMPSRAVDVIPYPFLGWEDRMAFNDFADIVQDIAYELGVSPVWGGNWNFKDYAHWQLGDD